MTSSLAVVFAGTPDFAVPTLAAILSSRHRLLAVYTQPDRPAGRGRRLTASPVKRLALEQSVAVAQPESWRDPRTVAGLAALEPDVLVVVAYGLILPAAVLAVPRLGCLNVHASLLPRWRGAAPIQRAILAGDSSTGVCIMKMEAGLDTGPVFLARSTPIGPRETAGQLHHRLAGLGAAALLEVLDALPDRRLEAHPQAAEGVTYAHKVAREEAVIDWGLSATTIDRQVRAFNPWPIAETRWAERQLRVHAGEPIAQPTRHPPGAVLAADATGILVATGAECYRIMELQLAGRRVMSAVDFLHAHKIVGAVLGR